jgi:hypothetical protein
MASAGIRKNRAGTRYRVWWRLDDGTQGSKTFDTRGLARDFKNELLAQAAANSWIDPRRGRILFDDWADHWWRLWSAQPTAQPQGHGDHRKPPRKTLGYMKLSEKVAELIAHTA